MKEEEEEEGGSFATRRRLRVSMSEAVSTEPGPERVFPKEALEKIPPSQAGRGHHVRSRGPKDLERPRGVCGFVEVTGLMLTYQHVRNPEQRRHGSKNMQMFKEGP